MAWWVWLLIDLGIGVLALAVTGAVGVGLIGRAKRLKRLVAEISAQAPGRGPSS